MTTAQRGGGVRALGASLLDQVLAETLDPAYEQAARARAAGERPAPAPGTKRRGPVLVAVTMAVAGLLVVVTYSQSAAGAQGREEIRTALIADIQRESETSDGLTGQLGELQAQVDESRDRLLTATVQGQLALRRLARAETGAGAVPVIGPGLLVTLANAEQDADADPVGGTDTGNPQGRVRDGDLQLVVNALWSAGAEAISVNGQRLGPTTAIRFAGEAVLVDFRPVTNPYTIRAVGDPGPMSERFLLNSDVRALGLISATYDLKFVYSQEDELSLPAANPAEVRLARPTEDTNEAATGSDGSGPAGVSSTPGTVAGESAGG